MLENSKSSRNVDAQCTIHWVKTGNQERQYQESMLLSSSVENALQALEHRGKHPGFWNFISPHCGPISAIMVSFFGTKELSRKTTLARTVVSSRSDQVGLGKEVWMGLWHSGGLWHHQWWPEFTIAGPPVPAVTASPFLYHVCGAAKISRSTCNLRRQTGSGNSPIFSFGKWPTRILYFLFGWREQWCLIS